MSIALALIAMLIELCFGYPEQLMHVARHPVVWIGALIGWLDEKFNRDTDAADKRRTAGVIALLILLVVVGGIALGVEHALLRVPFGLVATGVLASTLIAQRSLHRHVADVADALEHDGVTAGRAAVSRIVGRDTQALDSSGVARAAIESLA